MKRPLHDSYNSHRLRRARARHARVLALRIGWVAFAALTSWGCASTVQPPESSLPGTHVVADEQLAEVVAARTANTDVPEAPAPIEGQRALPEPDPTSGAGTLLIYTAITGHAPFDGGSDPTDNWSLGRESLASGQLNREIQAELRRRQEALDGLGPDVSGRASIDSLITGASIAERANPRITPRAPDDGVDRSQLQIEPISIVAGSWGNPGTLDVERAVIDENADGTPEKILYFVPQSDELLRIEQDLSLDGRVDTWQSYEQGELVQRARDTNADGVTDVWEAYFDGRMTTRTIDRNRNGVVDSFYEYAGDTLAEARLDNDSDGDVDQRIVYENLFRVSEEEDRDRDGKMDTWTTYGVARGDEVVVQIERASKGGGAPDIFEHYDTSSGKSVLAKREEDQDGDGIIDVTSLYQDGKLVRRETTNSEPKPL